MDTGRISLVFCFLVTFASAMPTMYKYNENKMLEPDLIAISSTVIPIPVYKVSYGVNVASTNGHQEEKLKKPIGPISLVTVNTQKKASQVKRKTNEQQVSSIKKLSMT